jgi:cbb3-type cytochrome oxidase subunit 3
MNDVYSVNKAMGSAFLTLFLLIFLYFDYLNEILRVLNYQGLSSCFAFKAQKKPAVDHSRVFEVEVGSRLRPRTLCRGCAAVLVS